MSLSEEDLKVLNLINYTLDIQKYYLSTLG